MDIRKLQRAIVDGLEDVKAQDIRVFNTEALSPLFERVIIASGTSNRQTKALASSVREAVKARGLPVLRTEGEENGEWIIVDCGAAVAHIMQPSIRDYYHLEEIWGGKPVRLKRDAVVTGLPKASEEPMAVAAPPARKRPVRTAQTAATATTASTAPAAARKTAPRKSSAAVGASAVVRRAAAPGAAPVRPSAPRKTGASVPVARKTATKTARKTASRAD